METATELKTYEIPVCRIGYGFATVTVKAESQEEANEKALDKAGNLLFSEKSSDYILEGDSRPFEAELMAQRDRLAASLQRCGQLLRCKRDGLTNQDYEALKEAEAALVAAGIEPRIWK